MVTVQMILNKSPHVESVSKDRSVQEAAGIMDRLNIGSLVVTETDKGETVVGIFTERDCLRRVVAKRMDPSKTTVGQVMTSPVAVCRPDTSIEECKTVMTEKRLRHIPVVCEGKLVGIVTSGDLLAQEVQKHEKTIEYLNEYLYGPLTSP